MNASTAGLRDMPERHFVNRAGWLRAAVLGANDGLVSTSSLILGVAAAAATPGQIFLTGLTGLVAGAMSMAAGEYVSVSSQADSERADLRREAREIAGHPKAEEIELADMYVGRGLDPELARQVARQLMTRDALGTHAREELGLSETLKPKPIQAALASAAAFAVGALMPLLCILIVPRAILAGSVVVVTLVVLAALGAVGARIGGAPILKAAARVLFWGALAMAVTSGIGGIVGVSV